MAEPTPPPPPESLAARIGGTVLLLIIAVPFAEQAAAKLLDGNWGVGLFALAIAIITAVSSIIWATNRRVRKRFSGIATNPRWFMAVIISLIICYGISSISIYSSDPRITAIAERLDKVEKNLARNPAQSTLYDGSPLGIDWRTARIMADAYNVRTTEAIHIGGILVDCLNIGKAEIHLTNASILSGIDGSRQQMTVTSPADGNLAPEDTAPIPAGAYFELIANMKLDEQEFLKKWGKFTVIIEYDKTTVRHDFDQVWALDQISQYHPMARPHVSKKQDIAR